VPQPIGLARSKPVIPTHLGPAEQHLFNEITRVYGLAGSEAALQILEETLSSLQRARLAREQIDRDGMTFGGDPEARIPPKLHPLLPVERDARAAALAGFKQLNLELLPKGLGRRSTW
jgi:hypothetical protein